MVAHRLLSVFVAPKLQERGLQQLQLVGSLAVAHGPWSSCGAQAQMLRSAWALPRPGMEPVSPALRVGLSSTVQPGKSWLVSFFFFKKICLFILLLAALDFVAAQALL